GTPGEVFVGGVGVSRGYLADTRATAAAFVPNPHAAEPGARFYRTGDIGRFGTDGTLELLGRRDRQIKVRGIRVDVADVEGVLLASDAVSEAAVILVENANQLAQLVAYLVPRRSGLDPDSIRRWAAERLPRPLVPNPILVDALPRTPNGKLDRRALVAEAGTYLATRRSKVAPRTPEEERLAALWSELLGIENVGIDDSFFDLGGDSLAAMRMIGRAGELLGCEISLTHLFETPTISGLLDGVLMRLVESVSEDDVRRALADVDGSTSGRGR
ncbi:MAG: phosphopantetheine-binding protein, partial [bacterium]